MFLHSFTSASESTTPPETLYHYCSVEAMYAILSNKSIWLSNALNMNDSTEVKYGEALFNSEIAAYLKRVNEEDLKMALDLSDSIQHIPYIFCLSENPDSLSQWRAYSNDGTGVAIGFNMTALPMRHVPPLFSPESEFSTVLSKITYDREDQLNMIKEYLKKTLGPVESTSKIAGETINKTIQNYKCRFSTMKNPAFSEEEEWRIIHSPFPALNTKTPGRFFNSSMEVKHRVSNGLIQSFFEYHLPENFLSSITLGPKCKIEKYDFRTFFWANGFTQKTFALKRSSASYR